MPEKEYIERYIKVYEYFLEQSDLRSSEPILLSILIWFPKGCYWGSRILSEKMGCDIRTVQRQIIRLQKKQWAAIYPELIGGRRYVWATLKDPPSAGPLFDYMKESEIEIKKFKAKQIVAKTAKQMSFW